MSDDVLSIIPTDPQWQPDRPAPERDRRARRRAVPLPLRWHRMRQAVARAKAGERWQESGYVLAIRTGRPVEPRNVHRLFTRVADSAGIRIIRRPPMLRWGRSGRFVRAFR